MEITPNTATYSVAETAKILGISDWATRQAIIRKELPSIRVGHRILVPKVALAKMLAASEGR